MNTLQTIKGELLVERARTLLIKATTVDEAKEIRDQMAAMTVYIRARGASAENVRLATVARLWAERRIGELTAAMPKATKAEAQAIGEAKKRGTGDNVSVKISLDI